MSNTEPSPYLEYLGEQYLKGTEMPNQPEIHRLPLNDPSAPADHPNTPQPLYQTDRFEAAPYPSTGTFALDPVAISGATQILVAQCHGNAVACGWWNDPHTGEYVQRNIGELLMLAVSELAEAMEGHRKGLPDDKLPHRSMFACELADTLIRIYDLAGEYAPELPEIMAEKLAYNSVREDHKPHVRAKEGGKKY